MKNLLPMMNDDFDTGQSTAQTPSLWYAHAMEQLVEVVQLLSLARDLATVMDIVRRAARRLTGADGATFVLRDNGKCFYAEEDAISPLWKGQRFPMSACISGWVMINRQSVMIEDIYEDSRIPSDAYRPTFVRSLAMVPIRTLDPIGAIGNYWATPYLATPEQIKVLQMLADTTAVALENIRIYEELEEQVRQRTFELQSILDNVQVGIIFTVDNRVVRANPKSAEIFRYISSDALLNAPLQSLLCAADTGVTLLEAARIHLAEGRVFSIESQILRRDKEKFWAYLIAKSLNLENHPGGEIWVIKDISDTKEKEKRLNELKTAAELANLAKDSFLATMSHEIRTPLTGMLGMFELLSMTHLDGEQRATLEAAWNSGKGLLRIVSDILDWSKIKEGKLELSLQPTSIAQLLQEVVNTYSRTASAKNLMLWQRADARLNSAHVVDALRLSQVLNNFVSNAIKFTHRGEVELQAELLERVERCERIRFSVRDTGIGIAKSVQQQLFQRYRQENADTARIYGGTGLGLAICRRLAELMDGQIELKSEAGHGSTFSITLTLPVCAVPGELISIHSPETWQKEVEPLFNDSTDKPWVLAVDDHPINRDLLVRQIKLLGLRAKTAENGQQALSMWQHEHFSLIITDCHMPEMDGYALSRAIRAIEVEQKLAHTPIIGWTANALAEEKGCCYSAGMDELLVKPASLAQLKAALKKTLAIAEAENCQSHPSLLDESNEQIEFINFDELKKIVPGSAAQIQVLQDFHLHIRNDHTKLIKALNQDDLINVNRIAHRMHGSSRMVGSKYLAEMCAIIERAAREGDRAPVRAVAISLDEAIKQFESFLLSREMKATN